MIAEEQGKYQRLSRELTLLPVEFRRSLPWGGILPRRERSPDRSGRRVSLIGGGMRASRPPARDVEDAVPYMRGPGRCFLDDALFVNLPRLSSPARGGDAGACDGDGGVVSRPRRRGGPCALPADAGFSSHGGRANSYPVSHSPYPSSSIPFPRRAATRAAPTHSPPLLRFLQNYLVDNCSLLCYLVLVRTTRVISSRINFVYKEDSPCLILSPIKFPTPSWRS